MHVVVVGCGRVGSELAVELEASGHTVSVIDRSKDAFMNLPERWSGRAVLGYGFDRDHLEQAGIKQAGAFAAVTRGDNTNIVSTRVAKEWYGVTNVVARIYDPRRALIYERMGIPTAASVQWATDQAIRRLFPDVSHMDWIDKTGGLSLVEYTLPRELAGVPLDPLVTDKEARLIAITRAGGIRLLQPGTIAQEGDVLHVALYREKSDDISDVIGNKLRAHY